MAKPAEIFDVVDENDRVIGQAPRAQVHAQGLRHRAVHVFLFNEAALFVQKRSAGKDTFPGCYDSSASGHVDAGEQYDDCAVRELWEELGLRVHRDRLQKHFQIEASVVTGWEFVWVYSLAANDPPVIDPGEIESGEFWTLDRLWSAIKAHPTQFAPSFVRIMQEFEERGLFPSSR